MGLVKIKGICVLPCKKNFPNPSIFLALKNTMVIKRQIFELGERQVFGRIMFEAPFKINSSMADEARFVYVVNGTSKLNSPNGRTDLTNGDGFIMKCENFVNNWQPNADGSPTEVVVLQLYPDSLKEAYNGELPDVFQEKSKLENNPVEKVAPNPLMKNFVESLRPYLDTPGLIDEEFLKIKIRELILVLLNSDTNGRVKGILSMLFTSSNFAFEEIVEANLYENLKLDDLAFMAGMSLSTFKRKFSKVYDSSPTQYIKQKRLEKACQLLVKTDNRISDIAYDCGFNELGYFSKTFQKTFNISPSDYRIKNSEK